MASELSVETVVECLVTDKMKVDAITFEAWVKGLTAAEAMRYKEPEIQRFLLQMQESGSDMGSKHQGEHQDYRWRNARKLVWQECVDQYQFFEWMTPFLNEPLSFRTQTLVVVAGGDIPRMLDMYYSLDDAVCRDLIGKAFTKAVRRDVDEAAETSRNITVRSARRQFDNIKRVMKHVEDQIALHRTTPDRRTTRNARTVLQMIREDFRLDLELASVYQHILFLCFNKVETCKTRLVHLDFPEWSSLAGVVQAVWGGEHFLELDHAYIEAMRVAKDTLTSRDVSASYKRFVLDHARHLMLSIDSESWDYSPASSSKLPALLAREQAARARMSALENIVPKIVGAMTQIGAGLHEWREVRDLFIDVMEKVLEPLDKADMSLEQVIVLFGAMDKAILSLPPIAKAKGKALPNWALAWRRCIEGLKMVTVTMYPKLFGRHA
mmetsp:Transcript_63979/g.146564  ORF Transcript_63979/g.146564 Transcript_63979/m.146564 type:complete len:438 (+) Transcript_63979:196-1509(+)